MSKIGAFVLVQFALIANSWGYTLEEVLNSIQSKEAQFTTIQFNFTQQINFAGMDSNSITHGNAIFKKPKHLRITKNEPVEQITISNGEKMWVYTPSYKQVWEGNWQGWINAAVLPKGMLPLGNFVEELKQNFNLSISTSTLEETGTVILQAAPKDPRGGYTVDFLVSIEKWLPVGSVFISDSAKIVTELKDIVMDSPVGIDKFIFKRPKGVEVINLN